MLLRSHIAIVAILTIGLAARASFAADDDKTDEPEKKQPFTIKLIDEEGRPVSGALAGVIAYFGVEGTTLPLVDESGWRYWLGTTSDADGIATFAEGRDALGHCCIVARQTSRKLIAVEKVDPDKLDPEKATEHRMLTLRPECRVSGRLTSSEFAKRNRNLGWTNVYLSFEGNRALACEPEVEPSYHFFLPPGKFTLEAYGEYVHFVNKTFTVKPGERELELDPIDLPPTRLALLQGMPAPELRDILAWKNEPVKLADLKGKVVLLDFWGYWCGPCVHSMPELFALYDKYKDRGLEIVGIHVDLGENETEPIDSAERLDERLVTMREKLWKGCDIPYPVALVSGKRISHYSEEAARKARGGMAAEYGVTGYPTVILIDPDGKVVEKFEPSVAEQVERLEKLLGERGVSTP